MYGVLCVVCSVWCFMYGVICMVCYVLCGMCYVWRVMCDVPCVVYGMLYVMNQAGLIRKKNHDMFFCIFKNIILRVQTYLYMKIVEIQVPAGKMPNRVRK